jgi:putative endonuclease
VTTPQGRLGQWGEEHARRHLESQGYSIAATNYRSRWGEVDIVARLDDELIFVEVKTRRGSAYGTPEESVTATKSQRLIATAQDYLQKHDSEQASWRIDVISIRLDESGKLLELEQLENAVGE